MRRLGGLALAVVLWTTAAVVVAAAIVVGAIAVLDAGNQRCFFGFPSTPCPGPDDPAATWLQIAFFGIPAVWLVGVIVAVVAMIRRSGRDGRPG